ncbi:MAG: sodium-dependent transporter [Brevinema sp.]
MSQKRASWASSIGVILAVAGSAVGLGNFLRFPGQLAQNGGGAFLIPYFITLLIIGLPISWLEWTIGRYAGAHGHGTAPGAFNILFRKPWAKYLGSVSLLAIMFIAFYYVYLESVMLGYVFYSFTGLLPEMAANGQSGEFFAKYLSFEFKLFGVPAAILFFLITIVANIGIIARGVSGGIEKISKILMPILLFLGVILLVRVLTLPGMDQGMAFMWNPDFSALTQPKTWLAAAGQIFFTLSIGMGAIINYASYIKRDQDITLSALSANATNEFAEVILGGMIIIPAAAAILGTAALTDVANGGTFGLGFITMPAILAQLPLAPIFSVLWFFLLFFAGITSSLSMYQPLLSFCSDELKWSKRQSLSMLSIMSLVMGIYVALDSSLNTLDEIDFWGGNLFLLLFGTIETLLFATHIDSKKGWLELHKGSHIKIPTFYRFILKYVTPTVLIVILVSWIITEGPARFMMTYYPPEVRPSVFLTRMILVAIAIGFNLLIAYAWKTHNHDDKLNIVLEDSIHD